MHNNSISDQKSRHVYAIKESQAVAQKSQRDPQAHQQAGLADLQQATVSLMNKSSRNWGFANSPFAVKRQRLANDLWKITIKNPRTREVVLEAEGNGDKMFAYEDSLARMAELLTEKGLKITTQNRS
jgi:hypothetical protein